MHLVFEQFQREGNVSIPRILMWWEYKLRDIYLFPWLNKQAALRRKKGTQDTVSKPLQKKY